MRTIATLVLALALTPWCPAGDIDPPAGAVAETMLRLDEVEPRTPLAPADVPIVINQPGSYVLTGNILASTVGDDAITITVDNVTLDLRGFMISNTEVGVFFDAINIAQNVSGTTIKDGTIVGASNQGVAGFNATEATVIGLRISGCGGNAVNLGNNAVVRDCVLANGQGFGVLVGDSSTVSGCVATNNARTGFTLGEGSSAIGCVSRLNGLTDFGSGFTSAASCTHLNCTALGNDSFGFFTSGDGAVYRGCTSDGNGSSGFSPGSSAVVEGCTASNNTFDGIGGTSVTVRGCTCRDNIRYGIAPGSGSTVVNNSCRGNDIGILVSSGGCRVEGNTLIDNDTLGLRADGSGSLIIGNFAQDNPVDYIISGGHIAGPTRDATTIITDPHPQANFTD